MRRVAIIALFLFIGISCFGQTYAPNIGFENGTFQNWQCYIGNVDPLGNINLIEAQIPVPNRQILYDRKTYGNQFDPIVKTLPVMSPNGSNYSMRLGNSLAGAEAERVSYDVVVPKGITYSIVFDYAVVLENPAHLPYQQPRFTCKIYDVYTSKYIPCPSFDFVASSDLPGFKRAPIADDEVYYKDWAAATIDLSNYGGDKLRIEFTTNDCTLGGHYGYAYLDVNENIGSPIIGNTYCSNQHKVTLQAPPGFSTYTWYNPNDFTPTHYLSDTSFLTLTDPPDGAKYAVVVIQDSGLGCIDTLYTTINKISTDFALKVKDTVSGCSGEGFDLTDPSITAGTTPGTTFNYYTDSLAQNFSGTAVDTPGTYYVQGVSPEGCTDIKPINVIFTAATLAVANPPPVNYPTPVDLSTTYTPITGQKYAYFYDQSGTEPLFNYHAIRKSGTYYVEAINYAGCTLIKPVDVQVNPPPYSINAPNTFTPNGDGINDHFQLTLDGFVSLTSLSIYSRNGSLVFTTRSPTVFWDGTINGQPAPVGTYYWIFEGVNDYDKTLIQRSGYIALVR